jgi:hypothetical protein
MISIMQREPVLLAVLTSQQTPIGEVSRNITMLYRLYAMFYYLATKKEVYFDSILKMIISL